MYSISNRFFFLNTSDIASFVLVFVSQFLNVMMHVSSSFICHWSQLIRIMIFSWLCYSPLLWGGLASCISALLAFFLSARLLHVFWNLASKKYLEWGSPPLASMPYLSFVVISNPFPEASVQGSALIWVAEAPILCADRRVCRSTSLDGLTESWLEGCSFLL